MPENEKIERILKAAVHSAKLGGSPDEIRRSLGLGSDTNTLHVEHAQQTIHIDTPYGKVAFVDDNGPSWVQYIDHRTPDSWEQEVILPEITNRELPVQFTPKNLDG